MFLRFYSGKETIYRSSSWAWCFIIADRSSTAVSAAPGFTSIVAERSSTGFPAPLEFRGSLHVMVKGSRKDPE